MVGFSLAKKLFLIYWDSKKKCFLLVSTSKKLSRTGKILQKACHIINIPYIKPLHWSL